MPTPVSPLGGKPPTGEPDAGNPPVRFGGRGGATQCLVPTPIVPRSGQSAQPPAKLGALGPGVASDWPGAGRQGPEQTGRTVPGRGGALRSAHRLHGQARRLSAGWVHGTCGGGARQVAVRAAAERQGGRVPQRRGRVEPQVLPTASWGRAGTRRPAAGALRPGSDPMPLT
jgi:hypothetical protein